MLSHQLCGVGLMLEDMEELFKLEPSPSNTAGNNILSSIYNINYCCFCLPSLRVGLLGVRVYTRAVRYVTTGTYQGSSSDGGYATPRAHSTNQIHSGSSSIQAQGVDLIPSSHQYDTHTTGGGYMGYHNAGGMNPSSVMSEEEGGLLPLLEPSRLHRYSNRMNEHKFSYFHAKANQYQEGTDDRRVLRIRNSTALSDAKHRMAVSASDTEEDEEGHRVRPMDALDYSEMQQSYGSLESNANTTSTNNTASRLHGTLPKASGPGVHHTLIQPMSSHLSDDGQSSDGGSMAIHFLDQEENFLDSLIGPVQQKGRFRA